MRTNTNLLQPFIGLLVKINFASSGQIFLGLGKFAQQPVYKMFVSINNILTDGYLYSHKSPPSPLVGRGVVWVEFYGAAAVLHIKDPGVTPLQVLLHVSLTYLHTRVSSFGRDLQIAHASLGKHCRRVGVDLDGFSEHSYGLLKLSLQTRN